MRSLTLDHLNTSKPWKSETSTKAVMQDYNTSEGIVREYCIEGKKPRYNLLKTKEPIKITFNKDYYGKESKNIGW